MFVSLDYPFILEKLHVRASCYPLWPTSPTKIPSTLKVELPVPHVANLKLLSSCSFHLPSLHFAGHCTVQRKNGQFTYTNKL